MKFFKKPSVAILLTVLLVALCCVWGYSRAYESTASSHEGELSLRAGENSLNYYLNWIDDEADLFTMETTDTLARNNLDLNNSYGTLLAIKTVHYLNGQDIETYSKELFETVSLGSMDFLLVIEASSQAWYLVYGGGLTDYVANTEGLSDLVHRNLDDAFFQGNSDTGILTLFNDLEGWCAQALPKLDTTPDTVNPFWESSGEIQAVSLKDILLGIVFTLLVNIWWIILLFVVLTLVDRHRFRKYIAAYPPVAGVVPPVFFRPLLFWHRHGSAWYYRMLSLLTEEYEDGEDDFGDWNDTDSHSSPGGAGSQSSTGSGSQSGSYTGTGGASQENFYAGPGPDVGPNAAGFSGGYGFQGNPEEAFRQSRRGLWSLWSSTCHWGWDMVSRLLGGRLR